jgi:hypothetical protein
VSWKIKSPSVGEIAKHLVTGSIRTNGASSTLLKKKKNKKKGKIKKEIKKRD